MASESVKVVVRCRPLNNREKTLNCKMVVSVDCSRCQCFIEKPGAAEEPPKQFTFDGMYFIDQTTEQMYNEIAYPLVEGVTEGYNGTIFAYGQTGSGKSFTMQGVSDPPAQRGVIPRAFEHIFETIQCAENTKFLVRASYLEIYKEEIRDLLGKDTKQKLELKEHPEQGVYVRDLSMHTVHSVGECERIMELGWKNRSVGYTLMNKDSSRSHSIFTIHLEICNIDAAGEDHLRAGKLNLVDLAGSERQSKTGATGDRLQEATKINLSLSALGNVISALVDGRSKHIPYRDSKLTRLLQDSLGGNTRTLMVACLSPADNNYEESLSTLRYANRAKSIQNRPRVNEDPKDALLRQYQEEIKQLKALISGQLGTVSLISLLAGQRSQGSTGIQSRPQSSEKEKIKQDYEEKLARLQADYNAEQESKAKLQEDIAALRMSYETKLSSLERAKAYDSSKEVSPVNGATPEPSEASQDMLQESEQTKGVITAGPGGEPGVPESAVVATPGPLDRKHVLERLHQLEQEFVGGEQVRNEELRQRRRQRKTLANQRKKQLIEALSQCNEDSDAVLLNVYDSIQEEVHAKSRLLENTQSKLKAAKLEIRDLQVEFAAERDDYLASIRRLERETQLLQGLLERMVTLVRRDCNYSNLERLRKEAVWDEESGVWRLPEVLVQKTALPAGESTAAARPRPCDMFVSDGLGITDSEMMLVSDGQDVSDSQQCLHRQPAAPPDSQDAGTQPQTQQSLSWYSLTQILQDFLSACTASHSAVPGNGPSHQNSCGSNPAAEALLPRPFRLESLGIMPANTKAKRKKSKMYVSCDGI